MINIPNWLWPEDEEDDDAPLIAKDMQAWSDSIALAGGILGEAYADADMLQGNQYARGPEPVEIPVVARDSFDPYDCTVLQQPMTVRRTRMTLRKPF